MGTSLREFCETSGREDLLTQWSRERNEELTPESVSFGSRKKAWWRCEHGHMWQAAVYTRTGNGTGCPYCAGRNVTKENSLAAKFPSLAAQWASGRNGALTPDAVLPGSNKRVWWKCERGHEWQASVKSRANGCGCPVCTNRRVAVGENDLATTHPELVKQWDPEKNGDLRPHMIQAGSGKKVWWVCANGHEWQASVQSRSGSGAGCPVCAGKKVLPGENDLASRFPALAEQWDRENNGTLTPQAVSPYSNRRVWWRCERGHAWQADIAHRVSTNTGCPYCTGRKALPGFNDLATAQPQIAAQWHPTLNEGLTPNMVTTGSHKKVWWQCDLGHSWKAVIFSRTGARQSGCPVCAGKVREPRQLPYSAAIAHPKELHGRSRV